MRYIISSILISLFMLAGCTSAPEPIEETVAVVLDQNYTVQLANGSISIDYPSAWAISAEFPELGITMATSEDLANIQTFDGNLSEGQVYLQILFVREDLLTQESPAAVLQEIIDRVENPEGTIGDIEARTLNGKVAAFVLLDATDSADGIQLVIDSGDAYTTVVAAVPDGDINTYQATVEAIASSVEYILDAPDAEATMEVTLEAEMTEAAEATEASE
ncbi:MAG: hypothetical protein WBC91_13625 [Phototrophicaceae bacterium]